MATTDGVILVRQQHVYVGTRVILVANQGFTGQPPYIHISNIKFTS